MTTLVKIQRKNGKIIQDCDVYIGRDFNMGGWNLKNEGFENPYPVKIYGRDECLRLYRNWLDQKINDEPGFKDKLLSLKGKRLGCWCKPGEACHGQIIIEKINNLS